MTNGGLRKLQPAIVIEGKCAVWPSGPQTLKSLPPDRERDRAAFWFGTRAELGGNEVWFRIASEAVRRMREKTAELRGARLVALLIAWLNESPDHQLDDLNEFQVLVAEDGETRIAPHGG